MPAEPEVDEPEVELSDFALAALSEPELELLLADSFGREPLDPPEEDPERLSVL